MSRAKLKITVKERKSGRGGKLLARIPLTVEKNDNPSGKRMYETKAELITHIRRGTRPKNFKPRRPGK